MSATRDAYLAALDARMAEITADQKEAREAIDAALNRLRDKGYDRHFVQGVLTGALHYSKPARSVDWPPTPGPVAGTTHTTG